MDIQGQNLNKEIGERFRQLRRAKDYSQEYMAHQLNMAQKNYSKLERGEVKWTLDRVYEVSAVLGVTLVDILPQPKASTGFNLEGLPELWAKIKNRIKTTVQRIKT